MKILIKLLIGTLIIITVLLFFKDMLIKSGVESGVSFLTGLKLDIKSLKVGIIKTFVNVEQMKLFNPAGFKDKVMLDVPQVLVDYDLGAIIKGTVHLENIVLDLNEFVIEKNEKGILNLDSLTAVKNSKKGQEQSQKPSAEQGKLPPIKIDHLTLRIGKVVYKDYSAGGSPKITEFNININEKFDNITEPYSIINIIICKVFMNTSLGSLTNFDISGLQGSIGETLAGAQKLADQTLAQVGQAKAAIEETTKAAEAASRQATQAVQQSSETLKKTTESLKDVFKNPFGGSENK